MALKNRYMATKQKQDEPKQMPNFKRYLMYANGKVTNKATGGAVPANLTTRDGKGYSLTNDKGGRSVLTINEVKAFFKPQRPAAKKASKKKLDNRPKLDYETAMIIRRRVAAGELRGALAKEYQVDGWTIQSIVIGYTYKLQPGDKNPIPPKMMREFLKSNLPKKWVEDPSLMPKY